MLIAAWGRLGQLGKFGPVWTLDDPGILRLLACQDRPKHRIDQGVVFCPTLHQKKPISAHAADALCTIRKKRRLVQVWACLNDPGRFYSRGKDWSTHWHTASFSKLGIYPEKRSNSLLELLSSPQHHQGW